MKSTQPAAPSAKSFSQSTLGRTSTETSRVRHRRTAGEREERPSFASMLAQTTREASAKEPTPELSPSRGLEDSLTAALDHRKRASAVSLGNPIADGTPAWVQLQQVQAEIGASTPTSAFSTMSVPSVPEANFGVMFEQFVAAVRIGRHGEHACVALTLDLGGAAPVQVTIEETSVGPTIDVQSDSPAEALALERALARNK